MDFFCRSYFSQQFYERSDSANFFTQSPLMVTTRRMAKDGCIVTIRGATFATIKPLQIAVHFNFSPHWVEELLSKRLAFEREL
jgi:hypothetical protein